MANNTIANEPNATYTEMDKALHVQLLSRSIWQPLTVEAFSAPDPQERLLAQATLTTFHNRHVGITPQLAAALAPVLLDPAQQTRAPAPWDAVIERLLDELLATNGTESAQAQVRQRPRFGLLLSANPSYSALRIMMPIVLEACRQVGMCYLFCADEVAETITSAAYTAYADALAHQIRQIATRRDDQFQLFWQERAITLSSLSRQSQRAGSSTMSLPEMDPAALRLLLQLNPELSTEQQAKKLPRLVTPLKRQRSLTRKEGGVDGIRVTRRMDDINNILMSEFMNPDLLLADRILNTGYLAIERPPERVKLRDVLIAALMPADVQPGLTVDFLKACWFDCLMQLSILLRQHKLHKSEFRWIEGDPFDRVRSDVFLLENMPIFDVALEEQANAGYRNEFLKALHWLPAYLDTRGTFQPLPELLGNPFAAQADPPTLDHATTRAEQLQRWLVAAWKRQDESREWQSKQATPSHQRQQRKNQLTVAEFAYVHVMLFLPANQRNGQLQGFSARSGQLARLLQLDRGPNQHVSITWVPKQLAPNHETNQPPRADQTAASSSIEEEESLPNQWSFEVKGGQAVPLLGGERNDLSGKEVAGALEQLWLEQLLKEMWRG